MTEPAAEGRGRGMNLDGRRYTLAEMRAILGIEDPNEERFWYAMRQLAAAYLSSRHEPTLLTVANLDAFAAAYWEGRA